MTTTKQPETARGGQNAAHTQGPWKAVIGHYNTAITTKGVIVAKWTTPSTRTENEANARLIAAAPCLLSALRDALAMIEDMERNVDYYICDEALMRRESAEAAIARATGA